MIIGQKKLLNDIDNLIKNGLPRFIVITGEKGQGKKTIANYICSQLNTYMITCGIKIEDIRTIIETAYKQTEPIIYLIPDADKMSIGAKNSLLKVIEEPPNNAYFIMTLRTINNTLETIKSRCIHLEMDNYTDVELNKFIDSIDENIDSLSRAILTDVCQNKDEIRELINYGVSDFYKYVEKVVNNIYKVQSANSFKLAEKLDIKGDGDGYDLTLFLTVFKNICIDNLIKLVDEEDNEEFACYARSIDITSKYMNDLAINGINKQSLIDMWILDIRKVWRD